MHLRRRHIWLTGLVVAALMVIFPPWLYFDGYTSNQRSAGYHFFHNPPPVKGYEEMFGLALDDMPTQFVSVSLNVVRLTAQLLTVAFLLMGLDLKLRGGGLLSGCLLTQGVCGILLLILLMSTKF